MKARLSILSLAALLVLIGLAFTAPVVKAANPLANTCVRIFENSGLSGDSWAECSTLMGDANLTGNTTGLNNGCNGANWPLTNPDWNDCISSFRISNLPGGYKVQFYVHANYVFKNRCIDVNGDSSWNMDNIQNDRTTSWRVESGNC